MKFGKKIYDLARYLWPLNRSIASQENLKTLKILRKINPLLNIKYIKSGKKVFDWRVPNEWKIKEGWIKNLKGEEIINVKNNNLHVLNYSTKIEKKFSLLNLKKKIFFIKNQPNAIPYITSYYKKNWGFCMDYKTFKSLKDNYYNIKIDSNFKKGKMHYGEILIKGKSSKEILFSTYICHPSMANNELSGPCLSIFLSKWVAKKKRNYSYRFVFLSETIGAISYIKLNFNKLKKNIICGAVITCVGDNNSYSFLPSKNQDSILDKIVLNVLKKNRIKFKIYNWLHRGSDERQYCWPNTDLPISSIMRSKYHTYKEYHTSLDSLEKFVNPKGLENSYNLYKKIINNIENEIFPISTTFCEPMLSNYNLYPNIGNFKKSDKLKKDSKNILNVLSYCDGKNNIREISKKCNISKTTCLTIIKKMEKFRLIKCY